MPNGKSRRKGDQYERDVVNYLKSLGVYVRRGKRGNDTGDILGIPGLVLECKDRKKMDLSGWVRQTEKEKEAAGANLGILIHKRPRVTNVAKHYVTMTVEDALPLLMAAGYIDFEEQD